MSSDTVTTAATSPSPALSGTLVVNQVKDVSPPDYLFLLKKRYQVSAGEDAFIEAAVDRRTRRGVDRAFDAFRGETVAENHLSRSIMRGDTRGDRVDHCTKLRAGC